MAAKANSKAKSNAKAPAKGAAKKPAKAPVKAAVAAVAKKITANVKAALTTKPAAPAPAAKKGAAPAAPAAKAAKAAAAPAPKPAGKAAGKKGAKVPTSAASAAAALAKVRPGTQTAADLAAQAAGDTVCREVACEGLATTAGYCRLHYIKNWKKIKRKELILKEKKLNQYIEELVAKYPDKYIEAIRQDLASEKDFAKVITDLDLDESMDDFDVEQEGVEAVIDSIKRDFEDEGEGF